ncbi:MAG TPA: hypothetical protein VFJ19_20000 [Nocardioidaceae bacterium]|nr:hypothetical protein [Nocardioidaceae bacterium]
MGLVLGVTAIVLTVALAVVAALSWAGRRRLRTQIAALHERLDAQSAAAGSPAAAAAPALREYVFASVPGSGGFETGSANASPSSTTGMDSREFASGFETGSANAPPSSTTGMDSREFASVALGESLVRIVSFGYGVARALSPESRNRIRFAMGREVKRARKQRRREQRAAWREWVATTGSVSTGSTTGDSRDAA